MAAPLLPRVSAAMSEIAPLSLADRSWDNVGVLVESPAPSTTNVLMLTIDLTPEVMEECIRKNVEVILSYHPPIFSSFKRLTMGDAKQNIILRTIRGGMSIYSPHTALDATVDGINDWLAAIVDPMGTCVPIQPTPLESRGETASQDSPLPVPTGVGRVVSLASPVPFVVLVEGVKKGLELQTVRVSLPAGWARDRLVFSVAVCAGSGSSVFRQLKQKVDVLFSGEMGHHDVLAANAAGQAVILCEHTNTERGYLEKKLLPKLRDQLGEDVTILVADSDRDPLVVW